MRSFFKDKKILIVGGTGFIGSSLVKKLLEYKCIIYLYVRNKRKKKNIEEIKNIKIIYGDIIKKNFWKKNIKNKDFLINLASNENKFGLDIDFIKNFEVNIKLLLLALDAASKYNSKIKIISFGSENQHGIAKKIPVSERDFDEPVTFFGFNKLIIEKYMIYFKENLNVKCVNLRLPNVYGPTSNYDNFLNVSLNKIINNALNGKIYIYSNKFCVRDFMYIDDVISAILITMKRFSYFKDTYYYIGSGKGLKIIELIEKIENLVKKSFPSKKIRRIIYKRKLSNFDYRNFLANYNSFKKITYWKPKKNISEGIKDTINYVQQNQ